MTGTAERHRSNEDPAAIRRELAAAVRTRDPSAFLTPARILRRVIREKVELTRFVLALPHRKCWVLSRKDLLRIVTPLELGLPKGTTPPDPAILIAEPSEEALAYLPLPELRRRTWRLLFHARIHAWLGSALEANRLETRTIRARIDRIGQTAFDEIRAVLRQEDLLPPPRTDRATLIEFTAFFLELFHFAPHLLAHYFPDLTDPERVRQILVADLPEEKLLATTRLARSPEPGDVDLARAEDRSRAAERAARSIPTLRPSRLRWKRLLKKAERASSAGNSVRAAILFTRAAARAGRGEGEAEQERARLEVHRLVERLAGALLLPNATLPGLEEGLLALLPRPGAKRWTREARTLFDLQKLCVDRERGIFTIDPVEWVLSFGRRPLRRWLPCERVVLEYRHLFSAFRRMKALPLHPGIHARLQPLFEDAVDKAERRLRETFRPMIPAAFREVGLVPDDLLKRIALDKLTEEILDVIVARGRLRMGDLRDAVSRNELKLPDVRNPLAVLSRDPLLRVDRKLAVSLDGVYRRAEFYVRWLQRFSALGLGTTTGRFLVRFAVIPFGGAFAILEGMKHLVNPVLAHFGRAPVDLAGPIRDAGLGLVILGLMHLPFFRRAVGRALRALFGGARFLLVTVPSWFLGLPLVRGLARSRPFLLAARFVLKPLVYTALLFGLGRLFGGGGPTGVPEAIGVFVAVDLLVNVPAGRRLEEITYDRLARDLNRLRVRVLSGLYHLVVGFFRELTDGLDRFLYSIDEWLRFRRGERRIALLVKPAAGVAWFFLAYVVRFSVSLFVEPQVNPIKHFPVVTVSHKLMLPFDYRLTRFLSRPFAPLGPVAANSIAGTMVLLFPGIAGFLVWELKENWKLYAKNRPRNLRPVPIGHHGETMLRLMKPGFHSGTLPKHFTHLRRAERKAWRPGSDRRIRRLENRVAEVEEAVRRFVERDLLPLLRESVGRTFRVEEVKAGSNTIRIRIGREEEPWAPAVLAFEEQSGWLVATVPTEGWIGELLSGERAKVRNALAGIYKLAGVEIVREQVRAALDRAGVGSAYDVADRGLVVWPGGDYATEVVFRLEGSPARTARSAARAGPDDPVPPPPGALLLSRAPLSFPEWRRAWELPPDRPVPPLLSRVRFLPVP